MLKTLDIAVPIGRLVHKCAILDIWGKKSIFLYGNRDFCQQSILPCSMPRATTLPFRPPKKLHFQAMGLLLGLPLFFAFVTSQ